MSTSQITVSRVVRWVTSVVISIGWLFSQAEPAGAAMESACAKRGVLRMAGLTNFQEAGQARGANEIGNVRFLYLACRTILAKYRRQRTAVTSPVVD